MEKTAIKNFAIEARKILMRSAEVQAGLYGVLKMDAQIRFKKELDLKSIRQ